MSELPARLPVTPRSALDATVRPPGSKSITNRALLVAGLGLGSSRLSGPLVSDDTEVMVAGLRALGVAIDRESDVWRVEGRAGRLAAPATPLYAGNSGTTVRFLTAAAALADGPVVIDGTPRMRQRPIHDLVDAMAQLGAPVEVLGEAGCPPVRVSGGGLPGGRATVDASRSSQYVTALLLAAPFAARDVKLVFKDGKLVSGPYVELTLQVMRAFGAEADWGGTGGIEVKAGRRYLGTRFQIEPDASAAAYPFCAAAIAGGRVRVEGIPAGSLQADLALLPILERMGCRVSRGTDFAEVTGPESALEGVDVDMNALPDAVLALAVVALFASGTTHIRNVANLRIKETDRLAALEAELRKLGARAEAGPDWLRIEPGPLRGAEIDTYDDHRMAMSFALAGLRIPGVVIRDPSCVSKTWPGYFDFLDGL
ncbi:MAG: 3-phosphoshikimate 1-carboxyvinyltransferase [Myxococcota bacterium]|nr:3-phosphoshikimate 1-carboxyvinyltransferase [Myxococcota bacterium]